MGGIPVADDEPPDRGGNLGQQFPRFDRFRPRLDLGKREFFCRRSFAGILDSGIQGDGTDTEGLCFLLANLVIL